MVKCSDSHGPLHADRYQDIDVDLQLEETRPASGQQKSASGDTSEKVQDVVQTADSSLHASAMLQQLQEMEAVLYGSTARAAGQTRPKDTSSTMLHALNNMTCQGMRTMHLGMSAQTLRSCFGTGTVTDACELCTRT